MYHDKNTDPRPKRTYIKSKFLGCYTPCGSFAAHYGPPLALPTTSTVKQQDEVGILLVMTLLCFLLIAFLPRPASRRFFLKMLF